MTTADFKTAARRIECEEDGLYFTRYFFKQRTGSRMIVAPHHQVIQRTLDRVIDGDIRRLIINVPPGYTKTELATINMMGRGLALNRRARFMHLSYSHNLALLNSSTTRSIVKSAAFQAMWPMALRDDADSKAMWWTEYGGGVYASSAAGQVTGFRAGHMESGWQGCLILDDPVKPDDAYSETIRAGVNTRFNETIRSRLAIETTPIVVIMQRIHYHDLSGYLLRGGSGEQWHHLNLPVLIDNSEQYSLVYPENSHAIPIEHGLPDGWLWPYKHNESHRVSLFSHRRTAEAQYMQRPRRFNADGALWTEGMVSPTPDPGYTAAWVITVDSGALSIDASAIHMAEDAPFLPGDGIIAAVQQGRLNSGKVKSEDDNFHLICQPPVTKLTDGMRLFFRTQATNAGACKLRVGDFPACPVLDDDARELRKGTLSSCQQNEVEWNATLNAWVLCNNQQHIDWGDLDRRYIPVSGGEVKGPLNVEGSLSTDMPLKIGKAEVTTKGDIAGEAWSGGSLHSWLAGRSASFVHKTKGFPFIWKDPVSKLVIQGGLHETSKGEINYPAVFPNDCSLVLITQCGRHKMSKDNSFISDVNQLNFTLHAGNGEPSFYWLAMGY